MRLWRERFDTGKVGRGEVDGYSVWLAWSGSLRWSDHNKIIQLVGKVRIMQNVHLRYSMNVVCSIVK